jgi:hypothetical protein
VLKPEQIDALVKDRQIVFDKARAILGDVKFDGKTVDEVRRAVVDKQLGELAKGWDDKQVAISFDTLTANVKAGTKIGSIDHARTVFAGRPGPGYTGSGYQPPNGLDPQAIRDAAYAESVMEMSDAWKPQAVRDAEAAARKAAGL